MADPDQITKSRTIFDASKWEIFWRNFIAGMARALGAVILYGVVLVLLSTVVMNYVWPIIEPLVEDYENSAVILRTLEPGQPVQQEQIQ